MSRKDYVKFAMMMKAKQPDFKTSSEAYALWTRLVEEMMYIFAADDPSFSRGKFLDACGMGE